jgi:cob(I)alamin adenosyltransferase
MLYTKYGDSGYTFTKVDAKTPKTHAVVHVLGDIDELNCNIGFLYSNMCPDKHNDLCNFLKEVMNFLFEIGAFVGYGTEIKDENILNFIGKMEKIIDKQEESNGKLKNFILPTGTKNSALAHVCRSICRRVERNIYNLEHSLLFEFIRKFFNRLSDYLFSLARTLNRIEFGTEILWTSSK